MARRFILILFFCSLAGMIALPGSMWAYSGFRAMDGDTLDIYGFMALYFGLPLGSTVGVLAATLSILFRPTIGRGAEPEAGRR